MPASRSTAIVTALLVVATVAMVPGAVSATEHLTVQATQDSFGELHVTVNGSDGPIEGATVNVTATDPNETYVGADEKVTDVDGMASFAPPEEDVNVTITVTNGSDTVSETRELVRPSLAISVTQHEDATATGTVSYAITDEPVEDANVSVNATDGTYAGEGDYVTDANGTFSLPAPDETVSVTIEAESDELVGETTVTLKNRSAVLDEDAENFGQQVATLVAILRGDDASGSWIGREVAKFVTEHNPGNAPDHAGPKDDTGPAAAGGPSSPQDGNVTDGSEASAGGPPEDAGGPSDQADKPDHAGGPPDDAGGPPEHAGGGSGTGPKK